VRAAVEAFGRVDILVNSAGTAQDEAFLRMDDAMWDSVLAVHLRGTFLCSQAFAGQVVAQGGGGRVVNTTGMSGMLGNLGQASAAAANAGVYGLTRTMAIELERHRITVNAIAPIAKTRLTEDLPMFRGIDSLTCDHVAPGVLFLTSDLCGDRTGHVLGVAGARVFSLRLVETAGRFKESAQGVWTAEEIAEYWNAIVRP
jgi:NAD(P)-dependent dehydrogenase (short-subunit alcohol dehydrogenase family)